MKLEPDVWHYLLNVYTMFQNDISKHVEKTPENFAKSKTRKNYRQSSENKIFEKNGTYVEKYTAGHLRTKFEEFTLMYKATIAKIEFDLLFAVNYFKVTQLWWNSNSTCRATYWMHILSFKLISQSTLKKSPENSDGWTDGRTDRRRTDIAIA